MLSTRFVLKILNYIDNIYNEIYIEVNIIQTLIFLEFFNGWNSYSSLDGTLN